MTLLFLLTALASACLTYNVYRPRYTGRAAIWSFFLGWLWGELAPHMLVAQGFVTLVFALAGAIEGPMGYVAVAILTVSCAMLAYSYLESESAAHAVERALCEGLGEDYERKVREEFRAAFERAPRWRELVRPFRMRRADVEKISGIRFDRQRGIDLELDIYRHRSMPRRCPVLLQIHGGAWVIGDKKEQALPLMNQMAARGWLCVSANYRLSPHATFPEHLQDVKKALAWVREHGERYGADPDFVVVTGGSAGGHLAALTGLTANDPLYQPGFEHVDTSVDACVPIYGVYDWTDRFGLWHRKGMDRFLEQRVIKGSIEEAPDLYRRGSPMDQVHSQRPPFLVVHGDKDSLAPVEEARRFVDMLKKTGDAPVVYAEIPNAQHAFEIFKSLRCQMVVDGIERYLAYVYSDYLRTRSTREAPAVSTHASDGAAAVVDVSATSEMPTYTHVNGSAVERS
jgi:acetyl esterase/lipase